MWCSGRAAPSLLFILVCLLAPLLQVGCRDPEVYFELGPGFAPEAPPPGQARIYVFWPAASPPVRGVYHLANPASIEQLEPGGYLSYAAVPGRVVYQVDRSWRLGSSDLATASMLGPELAITALPQRVYYLRVAPRPGLVDHLALESVAAATGQAEIRRCHRLQWKAALFAGRAPMPPR